jgi:hypothetical protein
MLSLIATVLDDFALVRGWGDGGLGVGLPGRHLLEHVAFPVGELRENFLARLRAGPGGAG